MVTSTSTVPSNMVLWSDPRRTATSVTVPTTLLVAPNLASPASAASFTPLKTGLFTSPTMTH